MDGLDRINAACGIDACVDLSATPFHIQGSGYPEGSPFPGIVSDFSLVDAIECGVTKIPRLPAADNTGRPDPKYFRLWEHVTKDLKAGERLTGGRPKPEVVYRKAEDALLTLAGQWRERFDQVRASAPGQDRTPPVLIVVCDTTATATHVHGMISGEEAVEDRAADRAGGDDDINDGDAPRPRRRAGPRTTRRGAGLSGFPELWNRDGEEVTLRIDSKLLEAAERGDPNATRKEAAEALRRVVSTIGRPGEPGEAAAFQLERLAERGVVDCYARNDHLEFNVPYELYGEPHAYEPDFIVRLKNGLHAVLEIKGRQYAGTDAKHEAARRWVSAVNHWGRLGAWDFLVCRDPQALENDLSALLEARRAAGPAAPRAGRAEPAP